MEDKHLFEQTESEADAKAASEIEAFVPTDYFQEEPKKRRFGRGGIIALCSAVLVVALGAAGIGYFNHLKNDPASFFEASATPKPTTAATAKPVSTAKPAPDDTAEPTAEPTVDPYTALTEQADTTIMQNILNIAFIGVDYAEERLTGYGGKAEDNAFHADVILILAVNFDENRVDLISIPRDTYAKIPGVKGIYKINASLDCGGGLFAENGAGFEKVCEAAEWMLGDIPVDYYYAVTMPAVKELVDAVGGVDYDLELDFRMQGRTYKKGQQHMDGQGVLDYLRVRKNVVASGDQNRVNRQKKMMIALFESMQKQNLILKIPDMLSAFEGQLFTNTNLSQTAALALFAYGLDSENIGMYSMGSGSKGSSGNTNIFNWNFCLTNQENRVRIIKEIYGIDVPIYREYTSTYAHYRWYQMLSKQYINTCAPLTKHVRAELEKDNLLPTISPEPSESPDPDATPEPEVTPGSEVTPSTDPTPEVIITPEPIVTPKPTDAPTPKPTDEPTPVPITPEPPAPTDEASQTAAKYGMGSTVQLSIRPFTRVLGEDFKTRKYTDEQRELFEDYLDALHRVEGARENSQSHASKYLKGKSNSLGGANGSMKEALDELKSLATQVAGIYGYNASKLNWNVRYEYDRDFNEIRVNFN